MIAKEDYIVRYYKFIVKSMKTFKSTTDNEYNIIERNNMLNFIKNKFNFLYPNQQIVQMTNFQDGWACVKRKDGLWNYMNVEGKIISPKLWFTNVDRFYHGFACVQREKDLKWNFINTHGKILSDMWFRALSRFQGDYALVQRTDYMINLLDCHGNILSSNYWFQNIGNFSNGIARVQSQDGLYNFINKNGLIFDEWYDYASDFFNDEVAAVRSNDKWNFIDNKGCIISPNQWFDEVRWEKNTAIMLLSPNSCFYYKNNKIHNYLF